MRYIITQEKNTVPSGFRNLTDDEISKEFLKSRLPLKIRAENGDFLLILPLNAVVY